ncbi:MAG TPA: tyrosine--tRNA ligase, partial [Candidatus Paceibacterota bacterium]|nr:tyrosine--tRNA ligase [Candidatus Paceibacterota bacterium]
RNLLDDDTIEKNAKAIEKQAKQLFAGLDFELVNNAAWLRTLNYIEFLRDIGKHFSVNAMLQRDSVKDRLQNQEQGISYTEFSYMLLQAYDFLHLFEEKGCDVQIGASDQWGNIISGTDLIRRKTGKTAYAFTSPLLINKSTGKKFGKSEEGAVWLDPQKTSPFKLYQFFLNVEDGSVEELLMRLTMIPKDEITALSTEPAQSRAAQKKLAYAVTELVHGKEAADAAVVESEMRFKKDLTTAEKQQLAQKIDSGRSIVDILVEYGYAPSKSAARRLIEVKGVKINGATVEDVDKVLSQSDLDADGFIMISGGKTQPSSVLSF